MTAPTGHMIVCGNDPLTHRLALDLIHLYRERIVLIVPAPESRHGPQLIQLAEEHPDTVRVVEGRAPDEEALKAAGITAAAALALTMDDDQEIIHAALLARGLNPRVRLVLQIFDRTLGRRVQSLLDRAAERALRDQGAAAADAPDAPVDPDALDAYASTTILSASATAAPALVAAAMPRHQNIVPVDGGMLTVNQFRPGERPPNGDQTIALLRPRAHLDATTPPPRLLPDAGEMRDALRLGTARAALTVSHSATAAPSGGRLSFPLGALFPRRLRLAGAGFAAVVVILAVCNWLFTDASPGRALYLVLMDVADMSNPENGTTLGRKVLQLLAAYLGMAITPVILALVLDSLGALGTTFRRPPRRTTGHVILIGLGKIGTRVLDRLTSFGVPVVCIERDPQARGLQLARRRQVPVVVGDVSYPEVYEQARIGRSRAVLALTSDDRVNLEAVLYARDRHPPVGVVLRLFDDEFAGTVYDALRAGDPPGLSPAQREDRPTVSRSVSFLAAPAFSAAMLGRQVLASIPVERQVLLVATVDVAGHPELVGRTVRQAFLPGGWRVIGLETGPRRRHSGQDSGYGSDGDTDTLGRGVALHRTLRRKRRAGGGRGRLPGRPAQAGGGPDGAGEPAVDWQPSPDDRLHEQHRVIVIATREGLGHLLQRRGAAARVPAAEGESTSVEGVLAHPSVPDPRVRGWGAPPSPDDAFAGADIDAEAGATGRTSPTQPLAGVRPGASAAAGTDAESSESQPQPQPAVESEQQPAAESESEPNRARRSRFRHSEGSSAIPAPGTAAAAPAPRDEPVDAVPAPYAGAPSREEREQIGDQPTVPLPQSPRALPSAPYRPSSYLRRARRRAPGDAEHPFDRAPAEPDAPEDTIRENVREGDDRTEPADQR